MTDAVGWLHLTLQGSPLTSSLITPKVLLNGSRVLVGYGLNAIPVPAGPLRVDVSCRWAREFGQAGLDCTVPAGQAVPVFYAAPLHQFTTGSIGHQRQPRKGLPGLLLILAAIVGLGAAAVGFVFALPYLLY
jgi:hypothetical protein